MRQLGLVALLIAEIVYVTIRFDSQLLDDAASPWLRLVAWSPQYLRLAITVTVVMLLLGSQRLWADVAAERASMSSSARYAWLGAHFGALLLFLRVSAVVFDPTAASIHPAFWVSAWIAVGLVALISWTLAFAPRHVAFLTSGRGRMLAGLALLLGSGAWLSGYLTEALWRRLRGTRSSWSAPCSARFTRTS